MAGRPKPIPEGYHTITPHLTVRNASQAIEFYKRAFGAEELMRMYTPGKSTIMHAELRIGDSRIFLGDEWPERGCRSPQSLGGVCGSLFLYVEDVDTAFQRAVSAGAQVKMPVSDMFWGDRYGQVKDPFGHTWALGQHVEDVTPEELDRRGREAFAHMAKAAGKPPADRK